MESSELTQMNFKDKLAFWINKIIMGRGYTMEDHLWDKLHNQIVALEREGKDKPDELVKQYTKLTNQRAVGRPNQTPL